VLVFSDGTMAASVIRCTPTGWSFPRSSKTPQIRNPYSRWNCLRCVSLFKVCFFWKFLKGLWCIFLPNELLLFQRPSYEGRFKSRWHFPRADDIFHLDHSAPKQITFSISYHVATSYVGGVVQ
jgi:hypothetical protein